MPDSSSHVTYRRPFPTLPYSLCLFGLIIEGHDQYHALYLYGSGFWILRIFFSPWIILTCLVLAVSE